MRVIHTADWHVGIQNYDKIDPKTGMSTCLLSFLDSIDYLIKYATSEHVDVVLIAGDIYKSRAPSQTHQRATLTRIYQPIVTGKHVRKWRI